MRRAGPSQFPRYLSSSSTSRTTPPYSASWPRPPRSRSSSPRAHSAAYVVRQHASCSLMAQGLHMRLACVFVGDSQLLLLTPEGESPASTLVVVASHCIADQRTLLDLVKELLITCGKLIVSPTLLAAPQLPLVMPQLVAKRPGWASPLKLVRFVSGYERGFRMQWLVLRPRPRVQIRPPARHAGQASGAPALVCGASEQERAGGGYGAADGAGDRVPRVHSASRGACCFCWPNALGRRVTEHALLCRLRAGSLDMHAVWRRLRRRRDCREGAFSRCYAVEVGRWRSTIIRYCMVLRLTWCGITSSAACGAARSGWTRTWTFGNWAACPSTRPITGVSRPCSR